MKTYMTKDMTYIT